MRNGELTTGINIPNEKIADFLSSVDTNGGSLVNFIKEGG